MKAAPAFPARIVLGLLRAYQIAISPVIVALTGCRCRFAPSCSHYAAEAVTTHGPAHGLWLAAKRIGRCHPWGGAGFDPVPQPSPSPSSKSVRLQ